MNDTLGWTVEPHESTGVKLVISTPESGPIFAGVFDRVETIRIARALLDALGDL